MGFHVGAGPPLAGHAVHAVGAGRDAADDLVAQRRQLDPVDAAACGADDAGAVAGGAARGMQRAAGVRLEQRAAGAVAVRAEDAGGDRVARSQ